MVLCKRCKKAEPVEGKKNCLACAKYMSEYMKKTRAKKKVLDGVKVPELEIHKKLPKVSMVINEDPVYSFDLPDDSGTIFDVNNEKVNNEKVNNVNNIENKVSPEHFRYLYFTITGKVFRENNIACIKKLIKILEKELK